MTEQRIRPYDVLIALKRAEASWPDVIVPRVGRRFSAAAAHSVLVALHSHYNWTTFNIALPTGWGHRARPARGIDIAHEVHLHPRTVGVIFRWLTDEQRVLETIRGHGWTGATVRRFNLETLGLADRKPDAMSVSGSREGKADAAEWKPDSLSLPGPHNQGYKPGDSETPGVVSHQGTDSEKGRDRRSAVEVQREAVEQVSRMLPPSRRERVRVLNRSADCQWSIEDNLVVVDFPRYDSSTRGYMWARSLLAELADVIDKAFGMEVELRFKGKPQQEPL